MILPYLKTIKWVAIGLILVAAFVILPLIYHKWREAEARADSLGSYAKSKDDSVSYYQNKLGQEVAVKQAVELDYKALQTLSNDRHLEYLKQFEGLKSNLKNLTVATNVTAQAVANFQGKLTDTTVTIDSVSHKAWTFLNEDTYTREEGTVIPDLSKVITKISMEVPIQGALFWQRKKILFLRIGKKQWRSEFTSPNPHVRLTKTEQLLIQKR
jgi:hypothetical protein